MPRFVALLRGINVSGHRRIAMAALRDSLAAAGLRDVQTYLQSGNVVFEADEEDPAVVAAAVQARIATDFGHQVEVFVLPCSEVARIASSNPFASPADLDERWFHATFLFRPATQAAFAALKLPAGPGEQAVLSDGVIFLFMPNGYGRSKLVNSYFEGALHTPATTRNWRTVLALVDMCLPGGEREAPTPGADPPVGDRPAGKGEAAASAEPLGPEAGA
jgi:uncharacterized protein (DUF1697 family)